MKIVEHSPGTIWTVDYPVHYSGLDFSSRMTIVRFTDGRLFLHSPCEIDKNAGDQIRSLGKPAFIVAPGSFHYLHVESAQQAFPDAETYICPGVERKKPDLEFDWILSDRAPAVWSDEMVQVLVRGTRLIWEVAFFHKASRTLILVDLIENIGDETPGVDWKLKIWWKAIFHMWNKAKPAPEYQLGWGNKNAVKASLDRILDWEFSRIIIAHGDNIDSDAHAIARQAWRSPLGSKPGC